MISESIIGRDDLLPVKRCGAAQRSRTAAHATDLRRWKRKCRRRGGKRVGGIPTSPGQDRQETAGLSTKSAPKARSFALLSGICRRRPTMYSDRYTPRPVHLAKV